MCGECVCCMSIVHIVCAHVQSSVYAQSAFMGCISYALTYTYKEWAYLTTCSSLQLIVSNMVMCGECLTHVVQKMLEVYTSKG